MPIARRHKLWLYVLTNALAVAAILEVALRIFPGLIPPSALRYFNPQLRSHIAQHRELLREEDTELIPRDDGGAPHRLWRFRPFGRHGANTMDSAGFCNPAEMDYRAREEFDLVVVGDSLTYCWSVPVTQAWPSRLGRKLALPTYSLGIPTIGLHEYVQLIKWFGLQKRPKLVIMNVYEGNDLRDAVKHHRDRRRLGSEGAEERIADGTSLSLGHRMFYGLRDSPLGRRSYSLNLALVTVGLGWKLSAEESEQQQYNFRYRLQFEDRTIDFNVVNADHDEVVHARRLRAGEISLELLTDALMAYARLASENDFVPVLTYTPSAHTVYRDNIQFDDNELHELMQWFHDVQVDFLRVKAEQLGLLFIDLSPLLRSAAGESGPDALLYRPRDLHLTGLGHEVLADGLASLLCRDLAGFAADGVPDVTKLCSDYPTSLVDSSR